MFKWLKKQVKQESSKVEYVQILMKDKLDGKAILRPIAILKSELDEYSKDSRFIIPDWKWRWFVNKED